MNDELQALLDFRSTIGEPSAQTAQRVYERAVSLKSPSKTGLRRRVRRLTHRPRVVLAIAVGLVVIAGAGTALATGLLGPSPGFTSGFSALDTLPPVAPPINFAPPGQNGSAPGRGRLLAPGRNGSEPGRWRLLQKGLFGKDVDLYGYLGSNGGVCLYAKGLDPRRADGGGKCSSDSLQFPGLVIHAKPARMTSLGPSKPAVYAILSDSVRSATVEVAGQGINVPIVNNSIAVELTGYRPGDAVQLDVTYDDATCSAFPLSYPNGSVGGWWPQEGTRGVTCPA